MTVAEECILCKKKISAGDGLTICRIPLTSLHYIKVHYDCMESECPALLDATYCLDSQTIKMCTFCNKEVGIPFYSVYYNPFRNKNGWIKVCVGCFEAAAGKEFII